MTTYGTIPSPTPPPESSPLEFISRAKERGRAALATRRPWRELAHRHAFSLPQTISDARRRVATNLPYFAANYAIATLFILFLGLLYHPTSFIVFSFLMAAWLFLCFLRDEPLVMLGKEIEDKVVLIVLAALTVGLLLLTGATGDIVGSFLVGILVVMVHATVRNTDDLFLQEEEGAGEGAAAGPRGGGGWCKSLG